MAVVKSNAYGHGLVDFSREMERLEANFLGVDSMTEARALRREGVTLPILVLGYTVPALFAEAARDDVSLTASAVETLALLFQAKLPKSKPLKIHIKVDTGMHRQGFLAKDLPKILSILTSKIAHRNRTSPSILIEGLYTHFASAKNPAFPKDTQNQIIEFRKWTDAFERAGLRPIVHAAATGATLLYPESHFDMVRIGIGLYGLWPEREVLEHFRGRITLKPSLVWKSVLSEVKRLPKGSRVGYGLTETLEEDSTVAVVPVGYWHGYPRALSSIGRVLVGGKECKVLGVVSMDMISVDVSQVKNPRAGDEVVVMGDDDTSPCSATGISESTGLWWYETVTRLNPLIKRIYK
jgi:alanine racemase